MIDSGLDLVLEALFDWLVGWRLFIGLIVAVLFFAGLMWWLGYIQT